MKDVCNCHLTKNSWKKMDLAMEIIQIKHGQSREIVTDFFFLTTQGYNFRQNGDFSITSVYHVTKCIMVLSTPPI